MPPVVDRALKVPSGDEFLPTFVASLDPEWIDEALAAYARKRPTASPSRKRAK